MELKHYINYAGDHQQGRCEPPPVGAPKLQRKKSDHHRSDDIFTLVPPMDAPLEAISPAPDFIDGQEHLLDFLALPETPRITWVQITRAQITRVQIFWAHLIRHHPLLR